MGGDAADDGDLKGRTRRAAKTVRDRVESLARPVPGHELADIRFERRTVVGSRSARALTVIVATLVVVVGGGMLIGDLTGGGDDGATVAAAGLSPAGDTDLPAVNRSPSPSAGVPGDPGQGDGGPGESGAPAVGAAEGEPDTVVVSVQGLVDVPGLRTVTAGTRVGEVLDLVGGVRPEARLEGVNLAEKVIDGMQVVVDDGGSRISYPGQAAAPGAGPSGAPAEGAGTPEGPAGAAATVNINTTDAAGLESLPGVGEKTARAIIDWRDTNGPFTSPEQLMEVKGIGPAKFEALRDQVSV